MEKKELEAALVEYKGDIEKLINDVKESSGKEKAELQASLDQAKKDRDEMQKQLDAIATEQKNAKLNTQEKEEKMGLQESLQRLLKSDEFKKAKDEKFTRNNKFSVKVDTDDITGTVNLTRQRHQVNFAPENNLAFIANMQQGMVDQDRNRVLWVDGAYSSNVGYVSEGTGQSTADTATATEKTRQMAKISAKLPITSEMLEDASYLASAFRAKMVEKATLFTDGEAYDGDGDDSTYPNRIYGIKGHATAFSATTAGVNGKVSKANIGDLIDAMILQAEKTNFRNSNILWMNPTDFFKHRTTKDTDGNRIFIPDVNGQYSVRGLRVIRSNRVTAGDMLLADTSKLQYWTKRSAEVKFSQMNGTDFINDAYTAVMFVRSQVVVETPDKKSLIFVDDIDTAVASLDSGV